MVVVTSVGYWLLNNKRYATSKVKRFKLPLELPQLKAKRPASPFIDGEVIAFDGGIKPDDLDDEGNWYYDALGMEPTGPAGGTLKRLKLGKQISALGSPPAAVNGWRSLLPFKGNLYASRDNGGGIPGTAIARWDGASWAQALDIAGLGESWRPGILVSAFGSIHAFVAAAGAAVGGEDRRDSIDGTTWNSRDMTGITGTGIYSAAAVAQGAGTRLYAVIDEANGAGNPAQLSWIDAVGTTAWTLGVLTLRERFSRGGIVASGSDLWFSGVETAANAKYGTIYKWTNNAGPAAMLGEIIDTYPVSAAFFQGKTYWGMNDSGLLYVLEGSSFSKFWDFDATGPIRVFVFDGALWAAVQSTVVANRIELWRYDGKGWSQPHYAASGFSSVVEISALSGYNGRLVVGLNNTTIGGVGEVTASNRVTAAQLWTPNAVYGLPGQQKPYVLCMLSHSALLSGQSVQLRHKLDDGAEVTDGANSNVGDTITILPLPASAIGNRLRAGWYITNGAAQDFTVYSMSVRAMPPVGDREVWEGELDLHRADLMPDGLNDFQRFAELAATQLAGVPIQAVDEFVLSGQPTAAMMAVFDPQTPLKPDVIAVKSAADMFITLPIRLLQAFGLVTGLQDGSFEQNAAGANPNAAWTLIGTPTSTFVSTAVTPPPGGGSKVLALIFGATPGATAGREQIISNLTALRYYTVGGWIRRATSAGTARIAVTAGGGLSVGTPALAAATDTEFTYYEVTFQLPSGQTSFTIRLIGEGTPGGTCYFDHVRIRE